MKFISISNDDIFISYARADSTTYVSGLASALTERGFSCFIDRLGTDASEGLPPMILQKIKNAKMFIVLCSSAANTSIFIGQELDEFIKAKGTTRMVVPVVFDETVKNKPWYRKIVGVAPEIEVMDTLITGNPSNAIINRIDKQFTYTKSKERLRRYTIAASVTLAMLLLASFAATIYASKQLDIAKEAKKEVEKQRGIASRQTKVAENAGVEAKKQTKIAVEQTVIANHATEKANVAEEQRIKTLLLKKDAENKMKDAQIKENIATTNAKKQQKIADEQLQLSKKLKKENLLVKSESIKNKAETYLRTDPAMAIKLAEAASELNPDFNFKELIAQACYANPVYSRFPEEIESDGIGDEFPETREENNEPFVTDKNIAYALIRHPLKENYLALYEVENSSIKAELPLEAGENLIINEPYATQIIGILNPWKSSQLKVYNLTPRGLNNPIFIKDNVSIFNTANGNWPFGVATQNGDIMLYNLAENSIQEQYIGNWGKVNQLYIHPSGKSIIIITDDEKIFWVGRTKENKIISHKVDLKFASWYLYKPGLPRIKWGPTPNLFLGLEPAPYKKDKFHDSWDEMVLCAFDMEQNKKQILSKAKRFRDNGLANTVFEADSIGSRLIWVVNDESRAMIPQAFTVDWHPNDKSKIASAKIETEGLLFGGTPARSGASIQTGIVSPNGNYCVISNDIRLASGSGSGTGLLESWNLDVLDVKSDEQPEGATLPILDQKHVIKLAYSSGSDRIAAFDQSGKVSIFNVIIGSPPVLSTNYRIPEIITNRLVPKVCPSDDNNHWFVQYTEFDWKLMRKVVIEKMHLVH